MKEGTGKQPKATDKVEVHYHGTLIDGTVFDSSVERGEPATFPVNRVIPGWIGSAATDEGGLEVASRHSREPGLRRGGRSGHRAEPDAHFRD